MDTNKNQIESGFHLNNGLFVPHDGVCAWEDLGYWTENTPAFILLDLDGNLYDLSEERNTLIRTQLVEILSARKGITIDEAWELWNESYAVTNKGTVTMSDLLGIDLDTASTEIMKPVLANTPIIPYITPDPELATLLLRIRNRLNIPLAVLTASPEAVALDAINAIGIQDGTFFTIVDQRFPKIDGRAYEEFARRFPSFGDFRKGMMIGDNPKDDIYPARKLGIRPVLKTSKFTGEVDAIQANTAKAALSLVRR